MTEKTNEDAGDLASGSASRRTILRLGAVAAPAFLTLNSAKAAGMAEAGASIMMCQVDMPMQVMEDGNIPEQMNLQPFQGKDGNWYVQYGGTKLRVYGPPPKGYYSGEELKYVAENFQGHFVEPPPGSGVEQGQFQAHLKYMKTVYQNRGPGYTCMASIVGNMNVSTWA